MSNESKPYGKLLLVASIIGALMGIYKGAQFFHSEYEKHIDKYIQKEMVAQRKISKFKLDSIQAYFQDYIDFDTKRDNILINVILAETEPKKDNGFRFYKTNPNEDGYYHTWYKVKERNIHNIIYEATYNPTEKCYGYVDRFNIYHLLK